MSKVRIELRHTKTVMRQSQDETWSYETRVKTRHECVETEPRQRRVNMSRDVSRRDTCLETPSLAESTEMRPILSNQGSVAGLVINRLIATASALQSSDPGQIVHTCPAHLKLRPYGAIEMRIN